MAIWKPTLAVREAIKIKQCIIMIQLTNQPRVINVKMFLFIAMMFVSVCSFACEKIYPGFVSHHYSDTYTHGENSSLTSQYNETNYGVGCDNLYDTADVVIYKNSYDKLAISVSGTKWLYESQYIDVGLQIGLVYGYQIMSDMVITPYMLPKVDFNITQKVSASVLIGYDKMVAFTLKYSI